MKKLSIICALVMVFGVSLVQAQPTYQVAPAGGKAFTGAVDVAPGDPVSIDIYLTGVTANQNAGGAWIDFTGSTADLTYVSGGRALSDGSEGPTGPWDPLAGIFLNEPAGTGTIMYVTANLAGAAPDVDGDLIVGTATLQDAGAGTTGLDPISSKEISELIRDLQRQLKMTSIVVTHDLNCASIISDRIIFLRDSKIAYEGTIEDLTSSDDKFLRNFFSNQIIH